MSNYVTLRALKRGETFTLSLRNTKVRKDSSGNNMTDSSGNLLRDPVAIPSNAVLTAKARNARTNAEIDTLVVTINGDQTANAGKYVITQASGKNTDSWPLDGVLIDVKTTIGNVERYSPTFLLPIEESITE